MISSVYLYIYICAHASEPPPEVEKIIVRGFGKETRAMNVFFPLMEIHIRFPVSVCICVTCDYRSPFRTYRTDCRLERYRRSSPSSTENDRFAKFATSDDAIAKQRTFSVNNSTSVNKNKISYQ